VNLAEKNTDIKKGSVMLPFLLNAFTMINIG